MNIEAYSLDSLRKLVRNLQYENQRLKEQLDKANIAYESENVFEEKIEFVFIQSGQNLNLRKLLSIFLDIEKMEHFSYLVKSRQEVGVAVTVITMNPQNIAYGNPEFCQDCQ